MPTPADKKSARAAGAVMPTQESQQGLVAEPVGGGDIVAHLPPAIASLFSNPPVLRNENQNAYKELLNEVAATMRPKDFIEFLWLRDFTDLTWEILRYRRMQKAIFETAEPAALRARFRALIQDGQASEEDVERQATRLAHDWTTDPTARALLKEVNPDGINNDDLVAEAFIYRIKELERLDKMLAAAEKRRNNVLREMNANRQTLAYRAQFAAMARRSRGIVDADSTEIRRLSKKTLSND